MTTDARFEDGGEQPLRLRAFDAADMQVLASLVQDAVLNAADISFAGRRFGLLINRVRHELAVPAAERVRAVLVIEDVLAVRASGIARGDADLVLSLLDIQVEALEDGAAQIRLIFAGDGEIDLRVEAIEATLRDVARPHEAVSGKLPQHPLD